MSYISTVNKFFTSKPKPFIQAPQGSQTPKTSHLPCQSKNRCYFNSNRSAPTKIQEQRHKSKKSTHYQPNLSTTTTITSLSRGSKSTKQAYQKYLHTHTHTHRTNGLSNWDGQWRNMNKRKSTKKKSALGVRVSNLRHILDIELRLVRNHTNTHTHTHTHSSKKEQPPDRIPNSHQTEYPQAVTHTHTQD